MDSKPPSKPSSASDVPVPKLKPVKRKRRPPAVPWKKPPDMPRRPLSAYNLYYRQQRESMMQGRRLSMVAAAAASSPAGGEGAAAPASTKTAAKTPGIGFANLTRAVAAKWKALPEDEKIPFVAEATKEKARYKAQMVVWRAKEEQKKAQKAGVAQPPYIMEALTSGSSLQSYATQLEAARQMEYPDSWFQASESSAASGEGLESALHQMGVREQQQRAMLAQQQMQQLQQLQQMQQGVAGLPLAPNEHMFASMAAQQQAQGQGLISPFSMRPMGHPNPFVLQQTAQGLSPMQEEEKKPEAKLFPNIPTKPAFWPREQSRRSSAPAFELRPDFSPVRRPGVEHRSSLGVPAGYRQPHHRHSVEEPYQHRIPRSQSFPSAAYLSPSSSKVPSPEQSRPQKLNLPPGLEAPLTPLQPSPRLPSNQSSHANTQSMLASPNMVPTPPQQHDHVYTSSPRDGFEIPRPLSEPPPTFPGEEEFQSASEARSYLRRRSYHSEPRPPPPTETGIVGDIRSCEEMSAEINQLSARQPERRSSLLQSTFEALDSNIDDEGVDFLSNLHFEE